MRILLVDNKVDSLMDKQRFLLSRGLSCDIAKSAKEAEILIPLYNYCCFIIDAKQEDLVSFPLLHFIRSFSSSPVIYYGQKEMLSLSFNISSVTFLEDIIPFEIHYKSIKKQIENSMDTPAYYKVKTLTVDMIEHKAYLHKKALTLTPLQFNILVYLVQNPDVVLSMDEIYRDVWKTNEDNPLETVQVNISRLRRKLLDAEPRYQFISTVRGRGYIFNSMKKNKLPKQSI